jgi:hypothetical protein
VPDSERKPIEHAALVADAAKTAELEKLCGIAES